ncbi:Metalloprotease LoiP [uncultured Desulfobacterium sp.]|uniref:Metalloprotease LoiP n=1 Tax=uncultured Desulfobacterium sp. TaxID=201089 RepID=A0A445N155_9BACT|nr:Metalloprotease LoiP [uncultured Desulfobacterium sp.]
MFKGLSIIVILLFVCLAGCEDTDLQLAAEAGLDGIRAITLSDEAVKRISQQSAEYSDNKNHIAPAHNEYAERLQSIVGSHLEEGGISYNYKVYLAKEVNAFAMGDGTIRVYSGLMDMFDDEELRFVIGHEMGHVAKDHIRKKMQLAYAASAIRKGIASQNNAAGDIARSQLGGFVERLTAAQFSQLEEKEADDHGLSFLKAKGYEVKGSVSALKKLAALGDNHSFLASHPAPGKRAERLLAQLEGRALSIEERRKGIYDTLISYLEKRFPGMYEWVKELLS